MQQLDTGRFSLDDRLKLKEAQKTMPSGILSFLREGLRPTIGDLLMLMIVISDNTATDMVLDLIGGPAAVTESMRKLGFGRGEINITMTVHDLFEDVFGTSECLLKPSEIIATLKENGVNFEGEVYREGSTVNVATPRAMTALNEMIFRGDAASRQACDKALEIMLHQTLNSRLPSQLPPGTPVAHKTGTVAGVRNDSGILYLQDDCHAVVTVFTRKEGKIDAEEIMKDEIMMYNEKAIQIDKAIGQIAKLVFEHGQAIS